MAPETTEAADAGTVEAAETIAEGGAEAPPEVPAVLDAPPAPVAPVAAPEVAYYRVTASARFVVGGQITELREGSVISTLTHRIDDVLAQRVPLARCAAPHTTSAPYSPSGYMLAPTHDFEMEESVDPLVAAAMGSDR